MAKRPKSGKSKSISDLKESTLAREQLIRALEGLNFDNDEDREITDALVQKFAEVEDELDAEFVPEGTWCGIKFGN
jgi:hypothetical protein